MKNKLAMVFSGGFSKGAAHLAIAKAFIQKGIEPDLYVGTSVGAVAAGAMSRRSSVDSRQTANDYSSLWRENCCIFRLKEVRGSHIEPKVEKYYTTGRRSDMARNEVLEIVKKLDRRFGGLEAKFAGLEQRFDGLETRVDGLADNLTEFKSDITDRFDSFRNETLTRFDHVFGKLDNLGTEYHSITYGMKRIEDEHRIINHAEILREINALKASKN